MRNVMVAALFLALASWCSAQTAAADVSVKEDRVSAAGSTLQQKQWIHGSANCESNADPAIEVFRYDQSSYILRQNKCLSFEAPFIYVLFGKQKVLVLDTGATESAAEFPLYKTVLALVKAQSKQDGALEKELLVIHSHSHGDHYAGDSQFKGEPNVSLVEPNRAAIMEFFAFDNWPDGDATIELGDRTLTVMPTPGHQEEALTVYDPQTKWLLTGDTFYPGYIYVKHWDAYKESIARLLAFAAAHEVDEVLGAHIEMNKKSGEHYAIGTTFQPHEAPLALVIEDLVALNSALSQAGKPKKIIFDEFIVAPMNVLQRMISTVAKWFVQ